MTMLHENILAIYASFDLGHILQCSLIFPFFIALKAAIAFFEVLNIASIWIAICFSHVGAVASVLSQGNTAMVCLSPVVTHTGRAHASVRIVATSDSDRGQVEE